MHLDPVSSSLEFDGLSIPVAVCGPQLGGTLRTPIVLVHGTGWSWRANFDELMPMLAITRRVVAADLVLSERDEELSLDRLADQVEAIIDSRCPGQRVCLVGYSLGAEIATVLAARRPELVSSLILIAGWLHTSVHQRARAAVWQRLREVDTHTLAEYILVVGYGPRYLSQLPAQDLDELRRRIAARPYDRRVVRLNTRVDLREVAPTVEAPTLVIAARDDVTVPPAQTHELFAAIPGARLVELPTGHAVIRERPAQVAMLIETFADGAPEYAAGSVVTLERA